MTLRQILACTVTLVVIPAAAAAHGGNNDPNVVHACVHKSSKIVRIVGAADACHAAETPEHWQKTADAGPQGPAGPPGPEGPAGDPGPAGPQISGSCAVGSAIQAINADGTVTCAPMSRPTRVFRYMTFDTYLETCCWSADNDPNLFGGVHPSSWTDGMAPASNISPDAEVLRTLFVRKLYPGANALVASERWKDASSTNGKVTAVLMRIRNSTATAIDWQPYFYFTAYGSWSERASVAVNGLNVWSTVGNHHSNSTAAPIVTLPPNQTSTVIVVVPSSPPWSVSGGFFRMNFLAFFNNSLNLPPGLSFEDDLDAVTGSLW